MLFFLDVSRGLKLNADDIPRYLSSDNRVMKNILALKLVRIFWNQLIVFYKMYFATKFQIKILDAHFFNHQSFAY